MISELSNNENEMCKVWDRYEDNRNVHRVLGEGVWWREAAWRN